MDAIESAKDILAGCLFIPREKIGDDDTIDSLKAMDSLTFEAIVMEIESHIGHEADVMQLLELRTVRDLADILVVG